MTWRPHSKARTDPRSPRAWAKCDRCGSVTNLERLKYQFEWTGSRLRNTRLKVCERCLDRPDEQLRVVRLGADPRPVRDPRPLNDVQVMGGYAELVVDPHTGLQLEVFPPGIDAVIGYPGSPFTTEQEERASLSLPIEVDPDAPEE